MSIQTKVYNLYKTNEGIRNVLNNIIHKNDKSDNKSDYEKYCDECDIIGVLCPKIAGSIKSICLDYLEDIDLKDNNNIDEMIFKTKKGIKDLQKDYNRLLIENDYKMKEIEEYKILIEKLNQNHNKNSNDECNICYTNSKNITLKCCGYELCNICKFKLQKKVCPNCREDIE
jgi:hypothetical protein